MERIHLPTELRHKVRNYYLYLHRREKRELGEEADVLVDLNDRLRMEILFQLNSPILAKVLLLPPPPLPEHS